MHVPQIAKGFAEDACRIIYRFKNSANQDFKCFCNIWLDMKFAQIFTGRSTAAEVMELSEECLNIAKYFLIDNEDRKIKTGGLFLIYSLYYRQPIAAFAKIRLLQREWLVIKEWWISLDKNKDDESIFILLKLYYDNAFKFVLENRSYGLEKSINKYFKELPHSIMMPFHIAMESSAIRKKDKEELEDLTRNAKKSYEGYEVYRKKFNLQRVDTDISSVLDALSTLNESLRQTQYHEADQVDKCQGHSSLGERRKQIKNKAFATTSSSYFRSPEKHCNQENGDSSHDPQDIDDDDESNGNGECDDDGECDDSDCDDDDGESDDDDGGSDDNEGESDDDDGESDDGDGESKDDDDGESEDDGKSDDNDGESDDDDKD